MHPQRNVNKHAADDELLECSQENFIFNLFRALIRCVCARCTHFEHFRRIDIVDFQWEWNRWWFACCMLRCKRFCHCDIVVVQNKAKRSSTVIACLNWKTSELACTAFEVRRKKKSHGNAHLICVWQETSQRNVCFRLTFNKLANGNFVYAHGTGGWRCVRVSC